MVLATIKLRQPNATSGEGVNPPNPKKNLLLQSAYPPLRKWDPFYMLCVSPCAVFPPTPLLNKPNAHEISAQRTFGNLRLREDLMVRTRGAHYQGEVYHQALLHEVLVVSPPGRRRTSAI